MNKLLKIRDDSTNYTCTVIKLPVKQTIPGLDNLVQVEVFGEACLIGKDSPADVLYLYFPAGCQLSDKFLKANNLYKEAQLNYDQNQKGFFPPNGRVKGLKLRGIVSNGFVIPFTSLECMYPYSEGCDISGLEVGDEFNEWYGVEVCRKWVLKNTQPTAAKGDKQGRINNKMADLLIPNQFRFHTETTHLAKNLHNINPEDILVITTKYHGSSCILSRVYVNKRLNKAQKLWNRLPGFPKFEARKMAYIASSGKPKSNLPKLIQSVWENKGYDYYTSNIWKSALTKYRDCIEEGISLYGELVGFTEAGVYIQKSFDYKCEPNQTRFVIYKITYTKPNGELIVFSWQQVKDYCAKYNLEHVKEFYFGRAKDLLQELEGIKFYGEWSGFGEALFGSLQKAFNLEKQCSECNNKVPAEGIVVWKDGALSKYEVYKLKSKLFTLKESNDEEANIEDQQ